MSFENEENETYGAVYDKVKRVASFMKNRDGRKPSFEGCLLEMLFSEELSVNDLEFHIPRYAEVWQDLGFGYVDYSQLMDMFKDKDKKKPAIRKKSIIKSFRGFSSNYRFLPRIDKNKIKTVFLFISLFVLVSFYYEWATNIVHHVELFFGVGSDSFLGSLAIFFWGFVCIFSGLFISYGILKSLYFTISLTKSEIPSLERLFSDIIEDLFSNNRIIAGLFVVFFLFFSSSSSYFSNYIGLKLDNIVQDEYTISGKEFLEYNERMENVPDEIVYEILDNFDNNIFRKEEDASIKKRIEFFGNYYEYIGFKSENFLFKETGFFQGYSSYVLKDGFFQYIKCLFLSFLETTYRAVIFFIIAGIIILPLLLLASKCNDEQLRNLMNYGMSILFIILAIYLVYILGVSFLNWVRSFFN